MNHCYNKYLFFIFSLFLCFTFSCYSQSSSLPPQKQYVKIEVGHHILNCPELPKNLKKKLMALNGINDYQANTVTSCITFTIPIGVTTSVEIVNMAVNSAFPVKDVNVSISDKSFEKQ